MATICQQMLQSKHEAHRNDGRFPSHRLYGFQARARSRSRRYLGQTATSCSHRRNSNASIGAALFPAEIIECPARMRHRTPRRSKYKNVRTVRVSTGSLQRSPNTACALVLEHKRPRARFVRVRDHGVNRERPTNGSSTPSICGLAGPTDVLTFRHGEIVISVETATRQAKVFRSSLAGEIRLYLLHGSLHLADSIVAATRQRKQMLRFRRKLFVSLCEVGGSWSGANR